MPAAVARCNVDLSPSHLAEFVERIGERRFFFLGAVGSGKTSLKIAQREEGRRLLR